MNDTNARDPAPRNIGHSPMNPNDGQTHVLKEPGLSAVGDLQQARIGEDRLYSDFKRHKAEDYEVCRMRAANMRNTGQYRFDRFRDKHLLSLCLHTLDIENLQMEIDSRMSGNGSAELGGSYNALGHDSKKPSEILEEKISSMRDMLKSYSADMLMFDNIMRLRTFQGDPDSAELNHEAPSDPIRALFKKVVIFFRERQRRMQSPNLAALQANPIADTMARFVVAMLGGASLIVPVVLMTFLTTRNQHLILTSVFAIVFALGVSFVSTASNQDILASTAAYAAVLVVFVGTSTPGP